MSTFEIPSEIESFLDSLNPLDVGEERFGNLVVKFEGFSDACWEDAEAKSKTIESLEQEIKDEWTEQKGKPPICFDWTDEPDFWVETVIYAIFKVDV